MARGRPKLAWKAAGFGKGYSSISVVGDRLYTMGDKDDASWVIAASADGGKITLVRQSGRDGRPRRAGVRLPRAALHAHR